MRLDPAKLVISIQSQVVFGHVGHSAAGFPLQASGIEIAAIPTVILSNMPGYPTLRGATMPPELFADLLLGAHERGLPERAMFLMTGYLGSPSIAKLVAEFVAECKRANPRLIYLCDPVFGDDEPGLYQPEMIVKIMREELLPLADLATPNAFELTHLAARPVHDLADLQLAAGLLRTADGAQIIVTGVVLGDTPPGQIETVVVGAAGVSRHAVAKVPASVYGTGDLFAALTVARLVQGDDLADAAQCGSNLTAMAVEHARQLGKPEVSLSSPEFRRALLTL